MLKVETIKNFEGFGTGSKFSLGEYYYAHNMRRSTFGIIPGWSVGSSANSGTLTTLGVVQWFAQAQPGNDSLVFAIDDSGDIYQKAVAGSWSLIYKPGVSNLGNGLIGTQDNKLLYMGERYLGRYDGTANYTTGTIAVTNGSVDIVGTGTTFTSAMVDKRIVINSVWYTIATFTDATHIALSVVYAGSTASGLSYAIYVGWDDKYKDFGASSLQSSTDFRPSDRYEDWVVMGNGNNVALLNVNDASFNATGFTLPTKFKVRDVRSGRTGILIGANVGNRAVAFLWDAYSDRSIAPWIWLNANIQSIVPFNGNWIIITTRKIYITNGYSIEEFAPYVDTIFGNTVFDVFPQGAEVVDGKLLIVNQQTYINRQKAGVWILDTAVKLWEFCDLANYSYGAKAYAIFFDNTNITHISYQYTSVSPVVFHLGVLSGSLNARGFYISPPVGQGNNSKTAEGVKLNLSFNAQGIDRNPFSGAITVKVANFSQVLWAYAVAVQNSVALNTVVVDGSVTGYNNVEVGDEVFFMSGANAGEFAHIQSIAGAGTATETWTLDRDLPSLVLDTTLFNVSPFKKVRTHTFTTAAELTEIYFGIKNKYRGKKFLIKIIFEDFDRQFPELQSFDFIYDDLGVL